MPTPEDRAAEIDRMRIRNMRKWIEKRLPLITEVELYDTWIDAVEDAATFKGDLPWLDLVEAEYRRRGIEPGTSGSGRPRSIT